MNGRSRESHLSTFLYKGSHRFFSYLGNSTKQLEAQLENGVAYIKTRVFEKIKIPLMPANTRKSATY